MYRDRAWESYTVGEDPKYNEYDLIVRVDHERKRASSYKTNPSDVKQSLNKEKRKKELVRITIENQKMFNRLTAKKANYETRFILR